MQLAAACPDVPNGVRSAERALSAWLAAAQSQQPARVGRSSSLCRRRGRLQVSSFRFSSSLLERSARCAMGKGIVLSTISCCVLLEWELRRERAIPLGVPILNRRYFIVVALLMEIPC